MNKETNLWCRRISNNLWRHFILKGINCPLTVHSDFHQSGQYEKEGKE